MRSPDLRLQHLLWLTLGITLAMLPHIPRIPAWIVIMYFTLVAWRLSGPLLGWPLPNRSRTLLAMMPYLLAITGLLAVAKSYGSLSGRDPGVALLVLLAGFKCLESKTERDFYIGICLGFMLVVTNFFYTQTIPTAVYMALVVWVLTHCFIVLNDRNHALDFSHRFKLTGTLLLLACPLMLLMFVLFPRVPGPLWGMPKDIHSGIMGIDDSMAPGSISQLLKSDALAFRVQFQTRAPGKSQFYWRGPVLTYNNGQRWSRSPTMHIQPGNRIKNQGNTVEYSVTLEPTNQRWLFALEMPYLHSFGRLTNDYQVTTPKRIRERVRYDMASYPDYRLDEESDLVKESALQLPDGYHSRTIALGRSWRMEGLSPEQVVDRALRWFHEQEFYYTLNPPMLEGDNVDQFMFKTRRGFCEHYASAFVVLMRAAGIPARVVTGYQGATYNPIGDYYNIYQRDAHAWAEVWLEGKGWQRRDPTSAVSPLRVLEGIEDALPELAGSFRFDYGKRSLAYEVMRQFVDSWDNLNYQWSQWVLGYGPKRQKEFMSLLGFPEVNWRDLTISLTLIIMVVLGGISAWFVTQRKVHREPAKQLYDRFCHKLAGCGITRRSWEGPRDYAQRTGNRFPQLKESVERITDLYISIRYRSNKQYLGELKHSIDHFKPGNVSRNA